MGRKLFCRPVYGWGWNYFDGSEAGSVPGPFHFQLVELFEWNGVLRGGFGHVAERDHRYHGRWVSFYTRGSGVYDLCNGPDFSCNVSFFDDKPVLRPAETDPEMAENWPLLDINRNSENCLKSQLALGQGEIVADEDILLERDRNR